MRTKTRASRARLSKLPRATTTTTTRPLPLLNLSGQVDISDSDSKCHNELYDAVAPDSVDKTGFCQDSEDMDLLEGETCITCGRGGQVVVCCETGCPMAFHQKCMTNEPKFDGMGRFYCRYCWYKRRVKRTKELRNMAMLSKKALSDFIDLTKVGGEKEKPGDGKVEGKEPDISEVVRDRKHSDCEPDISEVERDRKYSDCENRMGNVEVENRCMQVEEDQENDGGNVKLADCDQGGVVYKFQMDPSPFVVHGGDNVHRGQEDMSTRIESLHGSRSEEMFEVDVSKTHEYGVKEDGEMIQTEDLRQIDNGLREEIVEDHGYESLEEEETRDVSHHASMKGIQHTLVIYDTEQERMEEGKDEQKHLKSPDAATSSTGGDTALEERAEDVVGSESSDLDHVALSARQRTKRKVHNQNADLQKKSPIRRKKARRSIVHSPQKLSSQLNADAEGKKRKKIEEVQIQNADLPNKSPTQRKKAGRQILDSPQTSSSLPNRKKKFTMSKKSRQPQISPKTFLNVTFANGKRKRLHWTAEEEEMLKEGVQKFSTAVNKNIPWRKILEFGRHVFDVTRTPIDLKDKWRNIVAKDSRN